MPRPLNADKITWHDLETVKCILCPASYYSVDDLEIGVKKESMTGKMHFVDMIPEKPLSAEEKVIRSQAFEKLSKIAKEMVLAVCFADENIQSPQNGKISRTRIIRHFTKLYGVRASIEAANEVKYFVRNIS